MSYPISTPVVFESATGATIDFNSDAINNKIRNFVAISGGDMLYRATGANNDLTRLPIGTASLALRSIGGIPEWGVVSSTGAVTHQSLCAIKNGTPQTGITGTAVTITGWDITTSPAYNNLGGAFNITTGVFTVPATGTYFISANVFLSQSVNTGTSRNLDITRNGTPIELILIQPPSTSSPSAFSYQIRKVIQCNSGDTLAVRAYRTGGASTLTVPAYAIGTAPTNLNIVRLS